MKKPNATTEATPADNPGLAETDLPAAPDTMELGFPVVGIGASAGGLPAFEQFFSSMPERRVAGMAIVLVQHLDPHHSSILGDIIKRYTDAPVVEVTDGTKVESDRVYIIPPNSDMAIVNGVLQLFTPVVNRGRRMTVDFFLQSLALDQREGAVGIILSGTGADGSAGLRAIKDAGGLAIVQRPESAEYDGMPANAIATGRADYILAPAEIPEKLTSFVGRAFGTIPRAHAEQPGSVAEALRKISILIRARSGHDFSQYKAKTVTRRVERRMALQQIERIDEYVRFLQQNPGEVDALFRDLLIGVTCFFRDPESFEALKTTGFARIFEDRPSGSLIRAWVAGCSSGEEAYSIAILFLEQAAELQKTFRFQIFATDIDADAVERARSGIFPASIAEDITPARLAAFFSKDHGGKNYRVHKNVRDMIVFSEQDLVRDPPFSRLDLISCRNVLIYMDAALQKKILPVFHYALSSGGTLFLGSSETVGDMVGMFHPLDRKAKVYIREDDPQGFRRPALSRILAAHDDAGAASHYSIGSPKPQAGIIPVRQIAERAIVKHLEINAALVGSHGDILYLEGRVGRLLEPVPGEAGMNILKMARGGLQRPLTVALHQSASDGSVVAKKGVPVELDGAKQMFDITVRPVESGSSAPPAMFLIVLSESEGTRPAPSSGDKEAGPPDSIVEALRKELSAKDEFIRSTCEELETSNEDLRSSNEEMQSVNEELQSTNEELETSKEELQSLNEELSTLNAELQAKVSDLSHSNNDISNLMAATGIGTIFVDHSLRVQRFTPSVTQVINLIPTDVGRPIGHIVANLPGYDHLVGDIQSVLDSLIPKEIEVQTHAGTWFLLRIRPYRTLENVIEGAVITFTETTESRNVRETLREAEALRRLAAVMNDSGDAIIVRDLTGRILAWNPAATAVYGWTEDEALAMNIREIASETHMNAEAEILRRVESPGDWKPYTVQRLAHDGRVIEASVTASALMNESRQMYAITTTERPRVKPAGESSTGPGNEIREKKTTQRRRPSKPGS